MRASQTGGSQQTIATSGSLLPAFSPPSRSGRSPSSQLIGSRSPKQISALCRRKGKPILVDIFAPWCPTCRVQKPILEELTAKPEFRDLVVLVVDFDHQTVRALKVQQQSTLIVYKGAE